MLERVQIPACRRPLPVHEDLVADLLRAHVPNPARPVDAPDATVAHVLATCAGYAYADPRTVATMMSRVGLEDGACVGIQQVVDAMFIYSTAYLVQSRCGRVVVLCYRGTESLNLGSWLGDADVGPKTLEAGGAALQVHSGFYRNVRATRLPVLEELTRALEGYSLLEPAREVEHPLEALYVTGHSLGGAMALLFALSLSGSAEGLALAQRLRAVYTFGQPMAVLEPLPDAVSEVGRRLFRYVLPRDVVPALPPAPYGPFAHIGDEYRYEGREWRRSETPVAQIQHMREIPRSVMALVSTASQRASARYSLGVHCPHHYIEALRPSDRVTEFGDREYVPPLPAPDAAGRAPEVKANEPLRKLRRAVALQPGRSHGT